MKTENIISAPRIDDITATFDKWRQWRPGTFSDFYRFITTPSPERDEFLATLSCKTDVCGSAVSVTYK